MTNTNRTVYTVTTTTHVDYPEKRGPSFPVVEKGTRLHVSTDFSSFKRAVGYYNELLAGEYDCGSEYCSAVQVTSRKLREDGTWAPARCVRRLRRRERLSDERVVEYIYKDARLVYLDSEAA